ncbi:MAG: hypothetical protein VX346_26335 [Planctomycetota bacterium]|nr:hypothetical protein [Planctomycetota bacterium]
MKRLLGLLLVMWGSSGVEIRRRNGHKRTSEAIFGVSMQLRP